jgi:hypothetical protein
LRELRCPECGHLIKDADDLKRARSVAGDHAEDRAAIRRQWIMACVGALSMLGGIAFGVGAPLASGSAGGPPTSGLVGFRGTYPAAVISAAYIVYRRSIGEPVYRALLVLGLLWLAYGVVVLGLV